jgi:hypothetical protein
LLWWQRQYPKRKIRIWSHGLALIVQRNPRATSICAVHGSTPLRISRVKNLGPNGVIMSKETSRSYITVTRNSTRWRKPSAWQQNMHDSRETLTTTC